MVARFKFDVNMHGLDIKMLSVRKRVLQGTRNTGDALAMTAVSAAKQELLFHNINASGYLVNSIRVIQSTDTGLGHLWVVSATAPYATKIEQGKWRAVTYNRGNVPGTLKRWYEYRFGNNSNKIRRFRAYHVNSAGGKGLATRFPRGVRFMEKAYGLIANRAFRDFNEAVARAIVIAR